jgi:hypothetical protein
MKIVRTVYSSPGTESTTYYEIYGVLLEYSNTVAYPQFCSPSEQTIERALQLRKSGELTDADATGRVYQPSLDVVVLNQAGEPV